MHTLLMFGKVQFGTLESFQPYQSLQIALGALTGETIHLLVPWLLSYLNGSTAAGFAFARLYRRLPGGSGPMKGLIAGLLGWLAMDVIFFPLLGLGPFATRLGLGPWPGLFSLAMMLAYSVIMGHRLRHDRYPFRLRRRERWAERSLCGARSPLAALSDGSSRRAARG